MTKKPVPINEAEAIFERFYDPERSSLEQWSFSCDAQTGGRVRQEWQSAKFLWSKGGGRVVGQLRRRLDLDISGYSHFMLRCNLPATCRLTARAVSDGRRRLVIDAAHGHNIFYEYEGVLPGSRLQELEMEITADPESPGLLSLFWLGVFDHKRRKGMRARLSPYDGQWEGLILPQAEVRRYRPALELFFDSRQLAALRRKVQKPYYRTVMDRLRETAHAALDKQPHRLVGTYPVTPGSGSRYDRTYMLDLPMDARLGPEMYICAFTGLVDQDYRLLHKALCFALAAAHCDYWDDSFMQTIPGGCWDHRAFKAFALTQWFVKAWDWAGVLLTPAGTALMARTLSLKSLPLHQMSLEKYGYMRENNQAIIFATGAILGHAALSRVWDHGGERLDVALAALSETVRNYTEKDGGAHEGLSYFNWSFATALEGYSVAARVKGVPLRQLVPECVRRIPNYLKNIMSTVTPGTGINVADGGKPGRTSVMGMLSALLPLTADPDIPKLWAASRHVHDANNATGEIPDLLNGPVRLPSANVHPPVFSLLKQTGLLCSCRPADGGLVRLQVIGAKADAGHTHADKGSFVLEAYGEEILIDRGICAYGDARAGMMQRADRHNMITPNDPDGHALPAQCPCPEAMIPSGRGDRKSLRVRLDGTAQWRPYLNRWVRSIVSTSPDAFAITDRIERRNPGTISSHLHSRFPWTRRGNEWVTGGRHCRVIVNARWAAADSDAGHDGEDGALQPVYHLTLKSGKGKAWVLNTSLVVEPVRT